MNNGGFCVYLRKSASYLTCLSEDATGTPIDFMSENKINRKEVMLWNDNRGGPREGLLLLQFVILKKRGG